MAYPVADSYVGAAGTALYAGLFGTPPPPPPSGNSLVLMGPAGGLANAICPGFFTVMHTGTLSGPVNITASDGAGGLFWPLGYSPDRSVALGISTSSAVFFYAPGAAGAKSITLSNDAGLNNPAAHLYSASAATGSATPFRLTRAGATIGSYATLQACQDSVWQSGDVVKCAGGSYTPLAATDPGSTDLVANTGGVPIGVTINTITIEAEDPAYPMELDFSKAFMGAMWGGGQPRLLTMGSSCKSMTVRGLRVRGARPPFGTSWYGAFIWTQVNNDGVAATLNIENCKVSECADGIKSQTTHYTLSVYIRNCVFVDNSDNRGLDHDIYTGCNALTHVEGCTFRKTGSNPYPQLGMGHFVKSRCRKTVVKGNFFDGYMSPAGLGGVAQIINTPNGGEVSVTGNVTLYYGAKSVDGNGNPLRYGDDQHTAGVDMNIDPSLTTHSILYAQNTVRMYLGRTPDGTEPRPISIYPTGPATTLLSGSGVQIPVTPTVRNNILAYDTPGTRLTQFLSEYPDNSVVGVATIADTGSYSGAAIAGSPAINDATLEWAGDYSAPLARTDSNRGGRTTVIPTWVPTTAWQWTDIPGTTWSTQVTDDGLGSAGAPRVTALDPGVDKSYGATWAYSGPCYSQKNHEFWHFGGGHAGTTINMATRYNLNQNTPNVTMVLAPTSEAARRSWHLDNHTISEGAATAPYEPGDGKLYSTHSYANTMYNDGTDEFISFWVGGTASSADGVNMGGVVGSYPDVAALARNASTWRPKNSYASFPALQDSAFLSYGAKKTTRDGAITYYWPTGYPLYKFTYATNTHSAVGGGTQTTFDITARGTALNSDETRSLHQVGYGAWNVYTYVLATGIRSAVSVTGYVLPAGVASWGLEWVEQLGAYIAVFIAGGPTGGTTPITDMIVVKLAMTDATNAVASLITMTGARPTVCSSIRGFGYDPTFGCLLVCTDYGSPIKAIKVQ